MNNNNSIKINPNFLHKNTLAVLQVPIVRPSCSYLYVKHIPDVKHLQFETVEEWLYVEDIKSFEDSSRRTFLHNSQSVNSHSRYFPNIFCASSSSSDNLDWVKFSIEFESAVLSSHDGTYPQFLSFGSNLYNFDDILYNGTLLPDFVKSWNSMCLQSVTIPFVVVKYFLVL